MFLIIKTHLKEIMGKKVLSDENKRKKDVIEEESSRRDCVNEEGRSI